MTIFHKNIKTWQSWRRVLSKGIPELCDGHRNKPREDRGMKRGDLQTMENNLHICAEVLNMKC